MTTHTIVSTTDIAQFAVPGALPRLDPSYVTACRADEHLLAIDQQGTIQARASLWWTHTPKLLRERVGCIGHYAAETRAAATALLSHAITRLKQVCCTLAVAPIDGSTFHNYRFVTQRQIDGLDLPPFFLEPHNPESWPNDLRAVGFTPMAEYVSALTQLIGPDSRLETARERAATHGVHVHSLDPTQFDFELTRVYPIIMESFRDNLLFAPLTMDDYVEQYAPMRALLQPDLILLAERHDELIGFLFALPDLAQAQRGETVDTVIFKTLAVLPEHSGLGVGSLLAAQAHTNAYELGYRHAIHALMHRGNRSRVISDHYAVPMRRYTLFALPLQPHT